MNETRMCERCDEPGAGRDEAGALVCDACMLVAEGGVTLGIATGPEFVVGDRTISWERFRAALDTMAGRKVFWRVEPAADIGPSLAREEPPARLGEGVVLGPTVPLEDWPLSALRDPVDAEEAEAWSEAVGLLVECLPADGRVECPRELLRLAAQRARDHLAMDDRLWEIVEDGAGWADGPPEDDRDLWTGAAMCLVSVAVDAVEPKLAECLDMMEPSDWLSTVVELVRSGPGTVVDAESLLALSARCMDVDSAAVDPAGASAMTLAFEAVLPVWRALDAVGPDGELTVLGAWGLPLALARAWAGSLPG